MRSGGNREGCDNSRNGSVDAALQKQIPHNHSPENIKPTVAHPEEIPAAKYQQDTRPKQSGSSPTDERCKKGDDQNAADIIDHSESGQKDFQAQRNPLAEQAEHSQRKAISVAIGIAAPFTSGGVLHTNI